MGRSVVTNDGDWYWFVPICMNGDVPNRQDPEPFAIEIKPLSGAQFAQLESQVGLLKLDKKGRMSDLGEKTKEIARRIFHNNTRGVMNYSARDKKTGNVLQPDKGVDLYEIMIEASESEQDTIDNIITAIRDRSVMEEGLKKV